MRSVRSELAGIVVVVSIALTVSTAADVNDPRSQVQQIRVPQVAAPRIQVPVAGQQTPPVELPTIPADQLAAYREAAERKLDYLPGQVLVKFRPGVGRPGQQRALSSLRTQPDPGGLAWIGDVALVKDPSQPDSRLLAQQLSTQPEVEYAEPNYLRRLHTVPNDPSYATKQWNLSSINMPRAWDISRGGSDQVIVAVIDSGVTSIPSQNRTVRTWNGFSIVNYSMPVAPSPDFSLSRFVSPRDFTFSPTAPSTVVIDMEGHGTHVAGTIGENTNNGIALAGIAYGVRIMPLKACFGYWDFQFFASALGITGFAPLGVGGCPTDSVAAAIRFAADNGANVINLSLGGPTPSTVERDALAYAISKGVFIAISNGNEFLEGNPTSYPAAFASALDGAMSVAATNRLNQRSSYSNTGTYTEIAAPGGDPADGSTIWQASIFEVDASPLLTFPRFDRYQEKSNEGTSMASPHVAGIAALLVSRGIKNPATIEAILRASAKDLGPAGRDEQFGFGLVQPFAALFGRGGFR